MPPLRAKIEIIGIATAIEISKTGRSLRFRGDGLWKAMDADVPVKRRGPYKRRRRKFQTEALQACGVVDLMLTSANLWALRRDRGRGPEIAVMPAAGGDRRLRGITEGTVRPCLRSTY